MSVARPSFLWTGRPAARATDKGHHDSDLFKCLAPTTTPVQLKRNPPVQPINNRICRKGPVCANIGEIETMQPERNPQPAVHGDDPAGQVHGKGTVPEFAAYLARRRGITRLKKTPIQANRLAAREHNDSRRTHV